MKTQQSYFIMCSFSFFNLQIVLISLIHELNNYYFDNQLDNKFNRKSCPVLNNSRIKLTRMTNI